MASGIRIEYPGAFYHIMARGNRRENLAASDGLRAFGFTARFGTDWHGWTCTRKLALHQRMGRGGQK